MALVKKKMTTEPGNNRRTASRTTEDLLAQLSDREASIRRKAARDLRQVQGISHHLVSCLRQEVSPSVRAAMFDALGENADDSTVIELISLLRSEDAGLRNGAVETLHLLPDLIGPHMPDLLADPDSDVRLFGLDILRTLPHRDAPGWLLDVLRLDGHVNVIAVAIDRLADLGDAAMRDNLLEVKIRFANEPFIVFSVDSALTRLEANHG